MPDILPLFARGFELQGVGIWAILVTLLIAYWKARPAIDKIRYDSDSSLRTDLMARITKLELDLVEQRKRCDENEARMRQEITGLHRQIITMQVTTMQAAPLGPLSPEMKRMVDSLEIEIIKRQDGED